ncbi:hypothetical protein DFM91_002074 [Clostridium beijerinckii]|nr:hypothetical protein [Clostridium beijerinckii]NRX15588.1 hypothetical protein [Clostridium beijerinckii]NRX39497.1 hypothetical protein [Clostridium beijerinckii]NSB76871.1 hypothetical protein [Clostridium beijerinckii]
MYSTLEGMNTLLYSVASENIAVGISLAEVVPLSLVMSFPQEHATVGATSAIRNPQLYSPATETTEYSFFRRVIT